MNASDFHIADPVIDCERLTKSFGSVRALTGLDLTVERGRVHGFLGPNGSGKSTAIRVLLGLLRADGGRARLWGADPWRRAVDLHRRLAYVPGDVALWPEMTGGQALDVLTRLRAPIPPARRAVLLERFGLDPTRRCRTYSKGNRQKVALVAAFAADVDLLVLDEPTSGLDPLMEVAFARSVAEAAERGCTVLLSSHILSEVEKLCDRVTIVRAGRTVSTGSLAALRAARRSQVTARTRAPLADDLGALPGVHALHAEGTHVSFEAEPAALGRALAVLTRAGVEELTCTPPTLEEVFLHHYESAGGAVEATGGAVDDDGAPTRDTVPARPAPAGRWRS